MATETVSLGTNPAVTDPAPIFFPNADGSDVLTLVIGIILVLSVLGVGLLFLRLHTLPERIAHKRRKLQFEIVAVLGLLALFTHVHLFWVAGLILALVELPDLSSVFGRMAGSLEAIAYNTGRKSGKTNDARLLTGASTHGERHSAKKDLTNA